SDLISTFVSVCCPLSLIILRTIKTAFFLFCLPMVDFSDFIRRYCPFRLRTLHRNVEFGSSPS
ncbi:hypothetical protein RB213_009314, partial [Colletotrichum asianum]